MRPLDIERIKADRAKVNAPGSVNHFVTITKRMFNWAVEQELLDRNPVARVKHLPDDHQAQDS